MVTLKFDTCPDTAASNTVISPGFNTAKCPDQVMDLIREEIDLPFNCYVYYGGFLGMAPMTYVHGVEIHLAGVLSNIENITLCKVTSS
jgi:hypothetical protein